MAVPHPDTAKLSVCCAVLTVSDTRSPATDRSGQMIQASLSAAGHRVGDYGILPDEPDQIRQRLMQWTQRPEIEAVILSGGTGIAPRDTTYDAIALLLEKCQTWGITILDLSTAYWHQLVEILAAAIPPQGQLPPSLRLVIVGGEKMEKSRAILWQKLVGNYPLLVNTYGPTEATVIATTQWINGSQGVEDLTAEIPIGYPLPGMETYILNEAHQLV
ncbi:MAG: AMP-binding protein, partial [Leptolyngbyaceae cyanobacterium RM2_2_4]|nr:AMP-binding protein [Leptolyngbyaceae cyanobacterium RM2_2_4]